MKTTMTLSANLKCNPFEIFDQEVEEVIMLINFYIKLNRTNEKIEQVQPLQNGKIKRVRVNDKTATGGWY